MPCCWAGRGGTDVTGDPISTCGIETNRACVTWSLTLDGQGWVWRGRGRQRCWNLGLGCPRQLTGCPMWARTPGGDWVVTCGHLAIGCLSGDSTRRAHWRWWCVDSRTTGTTTSPLSSFRMAGPSMPSDLGVRAGVAHWGAHRGVRIGPGGCTSSDTLREQGRQPRCRFAQQGLSVSLGTSVMNTEISTFIYITFSYLYCFQSLLVTNDSIP